MRASLEVRPVCVLALEGLEGEGEGAVCQLFVCACMHACMCVFVCARARACASCPERPHGERARAPKPRERRRAPPPAPWRGAVVDDAAPSMLYHASRRRPAVAEPTAVRPGAEWLPDRAR